MLEVGRSVVAVALEVDTEVSPIGETLLSKCSRSMVCDAAMFVAFDVVAAKDEEGADAGSIKSDRGNCCRCCC